MSIGISESDLLISDCEAILVEMKKGKRTPEVSSSPIPLAPASLFRFITGMLDQSQLDTATVLRAVGISDSMLNSDSSQLPFSRLLELVETASAVTGIDDLAIRLSKFLQPKGLGPLGYVALNSPTVGEAFKNTARYIRVLGDSLYAGVQTSPKGLILDYVVEGLPEFPKRQDAEMTAVIALNAARTMLDSNVSPLEVHFEHSPPKDIKPYRKFFGAPILFGQGINRMIFSLDLAGRPVKGADPILLSIVTEHLDRILADKPRIDELEAVIEVIVRGSINTGPVSLERVASRLNVTPRTLQRHLNKRGLSFGAIVDRIRNERASSLLIESNLQIKEIALLTGFARSAAFAKAFKSWNGLSPNDFRKKGEAKKSHEKSGSTKKP